MEKYYRVCFDEIGTEMTLFENKFLKDSQYTKSSDKQYIFTDVIYEEKVLEPNVKFLKQRFLYGGYSLKAKESYYCNDYEKDGFMYDNNNQRIVYGKSPIYATLVGDSFVEVITGQVIPRNFIKVCTEIESLELLHVMENDLIRVSKYIDIYSINLSDWISMLSSDYVNMCAVQDEYDYLCFKKYREEYGELAEAYCDFDSLSKNIKNETILKVGEHQKIKKIIENIRKSSSN